MFPDLAQPDQAYEGLIDAELSGELAEGLVCGSNRQYIGLV
jgi:hypothetical protein